MDKPACLSPGVTVDSLWTMTSETAEYLEFLISKISGLWWYYYYYYYYYYYIFYYFLEGGRKGEKY